MTDYIQRLDESTIGGLLSHPAYLDSLAALISPNLIAGSVMTKLPPNAAKTLCYLPIEMTAGLQVDWVDGEGGRKPVSPAMELQRNSLELYELAGISVTTERLSEESFVGMQNVITNELARAVKEKVDAELWNGEGPTTAAPKKARGLLQTAGHLVVDLVDEFGSGGGLSGGDRAYLGQGLRAMAKRMRCQDRYDGRALVFAMHSHVFAELQGQEDSIGHPKWPTLQAAPYSLFGIPVEVSNAIPCSTLDTSGDFRTSKVILTAPSEIFFGYAVAAVETSKDATVLDGAGNPIYLWQNNLMGYRVHARLSSVYVRTSRFNPCVTCEVSV